jgi:hypothetical protein
LLLLHFGGLDAFDGATGAPLGAFAAFPAPVFDPHLAFGPCR